jgi:DNA-binding MarR family transcriptional regulator
MPHRISIGDPVNDTWVLFHQVSDSIGKCEDEVFKKVGMMVQEYQVFRAMKYIKGAVTPMKITRFLDKNPNYVTFLINRLEKKGLVERKRDLNDRRSLRLVLTPEGERKYKVVSELAEELPKILLSVFSREELLTLDNQLIKIREKTYEYRNIEDKDIIE